MKFISALAAACLTATLCNGQNRLVVVIKNAESKAPIAGAVAGIPNTTFAGVANENGIAIIDGIPNGKQVIRYHFAGAQDAADTIIFPRATNDTLFKLLQLEEEEMEEVTVSTTRSSRTIQDIATRIELISGEELGEKGNMKPGDIKMVLSESTGIQVLQTSATSGNASIRIEGLDGRYTQILKDGYPMYAGFSGSLGLLQTPPLDLKRVEIIKGASSTLYGGGAIAGLVNLISKTPNAKRELDFMLNGTSAKGFDGSMFYAKKWGKLGMTNYAAFNSNEPFAPGNTEFTAIPQFQRYTLSSKLFYNPDSTTEIVFGVNGIVENRIGGDIKYLQGSGDSVHNYFEDNKSERIGSVFEIRKNLEKKGRIALRNTVNHFNRIISTPDNAFDGTQTSSFTEATYAVTKGKMEWIAGLNFITDKFEEKKLTSVPLRNYSLTTLGGFVQNTIDVNESVVIESGLRCDYVNDYGFVPLPRISILYKNNKNFTTRLGGGLGYKAPTIFTEESERIGYKSVLPIVPSQNEFEKSYGANWDANYKTTIFDGRVSFAINQLLFYTELSSPLLLAPTGTGFYEFKNHAGHIDAKGAETNIKLGYKHLKLFLGLTYTHSHIHDGNTYTETPLTPKIHTNTVLMYEVEGKFKSGLEMYYYSPQQLSDGTTGKEYWLCGFMAEKIWEKWSLYINFENMLDARQSKFAPIYTGSVSRPSFTDIYAPLDGFVFNGGVKIRL